MNILIRADSSSTMGTGHVMRDLVLAKQFSGGNITFASQDLKGNINHKILESGYKLNLLESHEIEELSDIIKKESIELIVIDHYAIDDKYEKKLKTKSPTLKIMVLDDTYKKHNCDILLNHNISANAKKYKKLVPKHCELRCGAKHTLLRNEFLKENSKIQKKFKIAPLGNILGVQNSKFKVFLAMGGADHSNINIKILKVLKKFSKIQVNLVTTTANQHIEELEKYVQNKKWIKLHVNSSKIAKLMAKSDFAIITPSVTANEVYFMNLPFIAIKTAANQDDMVKYLKKKEYLILKKFNEKKLESSIEKMMAKERQEVALIDFVDLNLREKKMILKWRNHSEIKRWMYTKENIELQNHLDFIKSLEDSQNKQYLVVKKQEQNIGVIDFTKIDKEKKKCEFGLYANPFEKTAGIGSILMEAGVRYAYDFLKITKLKLEVFEENLRAQSLYKKYGFKKIAEKYVDERKVICMELLKDKLK